ncbi:MULTISPECIES: hypothetical protein [Pseudoalteromonas]|uniref:Uncharacterized protein n=1 Tax=Pseudoalteromonas maricaloris TaxID=184924 RepID=A0A8I2H8S3_9GAMM|nr:MULTISPECIES: hypothetical protein [Pseudoalteromonas]KID36567.1 hypothetical protein QT15_08645 [Pseudoalteromonas flavipulchra NCIMB 2033 = ATCC BAA-314]MBD0782561.1 hypothetical protein [Pseudoalteromonas flavipulchra]MBE0373818.1 hypothetical protein [Pseudoalteromonas flavipulchra NCIMB 2033 = ATCC BAA-314]NLR24242.1 hypothetical protein [Pseudoalteromonas maricaloris]RZG17144.1 hypothetical protein EXT47_03735 [Pseudoalteromonas sp. CO342X]
MSNLDKFDAKLKAAYQASKQDKPLTLTTRIKVRLVSFAHHFLGRIETWQWSAVTCSVALLFSLWYQNQHVDIDKEYNSSAHLVSYGDFQHIETHELQQGQYLARIDEQKKVLDARFEAAQQQVQEQRYGRLVAINDDAWLIEECNTHTLIELKQSLLSVMPQPKTSVINFNTPVMLALSTANNGQIIAIESTGQNQVLACP